MAVGMFWRRKTRPRLLELSGTVIIPATTDWFLATQKFVLNSGPGVKISYLGPNFKQLIFGKTEEPMAETKLCYAELTRPSASSQILAELGDKAKTTPARIWALLELQPNGGYGVLLTKGLVTNLFNVDDCMVSVCWRGDGWYVNAYSVGESFEWVDGCRVFSHNS